MSFDRSLLPAARLELAVLGDTHFILDAEAYAVEFDSVRTWPARAAHALRRAAALEADLVVHLGDLSEEPPVHADHATSRDVACDSLRDAGLQPVFVPGNMDIGDKPDPTMWTPPVSDETLQWFHDRFGPSWHSRNLADCHLVFLNSQILNGDLDAAAEQARWLEEDLAAHEGERILLFLHMPPFFVAEDEPDTGFYNSIDEPARSWLTSLFRRHRVDAVFCGHTHFRAFNRVDDTRVHVCPSTTTSRAGFYEAFTVAPPPESGRNDPAKLGFCLVRITEGGTRVHFIRTEGRIADDRSGWDEVLTPTSHDLPASRLGLHLRSPLAVEAAGALAWPSVKRQRVRDDHPFLHAIELGARHVRVPASDLSDPLQSARLRLLRDEGIAVTAVYVASPRLDLAATLDAAHPPPHTVEIQMPRQALPDRDTLAAIAAASDRGLVTSLAPLLPMQRTAGRYHPRARTGYAPEELADLDEALKDAGVGSVRVVGWLDPSLDVASAIAAFDGTLCGHVDGLDLVLPLAADETERRRQLCDALVAVALRPACRLFLDPYVDLDRTNDVSQGLLDRLGNPRPAFHLARCLGALLATRAGWRREGEALVDGSGARLVVSANGGKVPFAGRLYNLVAARSRDTLAGETAHGPWALLAT